MHHTHSPLQGSPLQQQQGNMQQQQKPTRPISPLQGSPLQQQGVVMPGGGNNNINQGITPRGNGVMNTGQGSGDSGAVKGLPGSPMPGRSVSPNQQLPPNVVQSLTQQILKSVNGRVSPSLITQLILHMHNTSGRVSPTQIAQKVMMGVPPPPPPQLTSSPAKPNTPQMIHPRMQTPRMPPPPLPQQQQQQQSPMMGQQQKQSPMMGQQQQQPPMMGQGQSPMMRYPGGPPPRMPHHTPPGMNRPPPPPHHMGGGRPMGYMYGLTPMNPR